MGRTENSPLVENAHVRAKEIEDILLKQPRGTYVKKSYLRTKYNIPYVQSVTVWEILAENDKIRISNLGVEVL